MATTARRPVDIHQNPPFDESGRQGAINGVSRVSSQRRNEEDNRQLASIDYPDLSSNPPAAPEVPRGPPISYRGTKDSTVPQRSFSQRAKGRPFAKEAFADDDELVSYGRNGTQGQVYEDALEPTYRRAVQAPLRVDTDTQRSTYARQQQQKQPQHEHRSAQLRSAEAWAPEAQQREIRRASDTAAHSTEPIKAPQRSSTLRDPSSGIGEPMREWAPDRSPLQKLEVTLNDISKEEKRARVEEAEMLLRESKTGRGGRRAHRDPTTGESTVPIRQLTNKRLTEPTSLEQAGLVRSLSSTQRDRLQHSATIDSRKPDVRRLSGEGRGGFEYQEQGYRQDRVAPQDQISPVSPRQTQTRRRVESAQPRPPQDERDLTGATNDTDEFAPRRSNRYSDEYPQRTKSNHYTQEQRPVDPINQATISSPSTRQGRQYIDEQINAGPSTGPNAQYHRGQNEIRRGQSARQAAAMQNPAKAAPTNITRAVSAQQYMPPPTFKDDEEIIPRPAQMRESNSSHKAALVGAAAGAAAVGMDAPVARTNSRKLQKAPPRVREPQKPPNMSRDANNIPRPQNQAAVDTQGPFGDGNLRSQRQEIPRQAGPQIPPQQGSAPIGLGLQEVPDIDKTGQRQSLSDMPQSKPRAQSVSFKEPFDTARPVDEWKKAGIAKLTLTDFVLERGVETPESKAWWEEKNSASRRQSKRSSRSKNVPAEPETPIDDRHAEFKPALYLKCGPLLRYTGLKRSRPEMPSKGTTQTTDEQETWRGSVLIVTDDSKSSYESVPTLRLFSQPRDLLPPPPQQVEELAPEYVDPIAGLTKLSRTGKLLYVKPVDHLEEGKDLSMIENDDGLYETSPSPPDLSGAGHPATPSSIKQTTTNDGETFRKFREVKGARIYADPVRRVTFWRFNLEIELGDRQERIAYRINRGPAIGFWVPARGQSMNIMFHSCNGFSMSVQPDQFSGPDPLWRDVLNTHQTRPFHVMIGGGDQVYNDRVMIQTNYFGHWTQIKNPHEKHNAPFIPEMKEELETFYLDRYSMWFSQGLFGMANSQIPMINMWDDHDIIDGFGSYPDHFMRSPVFSGLGNIAFKYYMLYQHHSVPEETSVEEPSWLLGAKPGPYITQRSRSLFMHLGKHVAFLGLDCRTERKREEIVTNETYDIVLDKCRKDIIEGETKHLILLLGVPIAYPRLVWLENVLTSRAMDPIKALGRYGFLKGGFLNKFDGGVEILDDLDDHWTATHHKQERNDFILDLQDLAAEKSVRITILGGDVHLAAIGQFYSNPKLRIPKDKDHRYMPNIISSAIVNTPPPEMMGDILNKRNKVHHLNHYTDEDMIPMFTHDVDGKKRNNKRLLPRRNWCSIREYNPGSTPPPTPPDTPSVSGSEGEEYYDEKPRRRFSFSREDVNPRNLFRRISSRGAPPTSYRDSTDYNNMNQRPHSYDGAQHLQGSSGQFTPQSIPSTPQRTSLDPNAQSENRMMQRGGGPPESDRSTPIPNTASHHLVRPGNFQRRPTNLSEKAARKGIVPGIDKEGNEVDLNDQINLEGGLDIILNCEVNQKDPAGITTPYRLLVPALWYDGSSDREKLDDGALQRKPTLLKRFGIGNRGDRKSHVEGSDEDVSDSESQSGSEGMHAEEIPPRKFGLFGIRGRRQRFFGGQRRGEWSHDQQQMSEDYANASHQAGQAAAPPNRGYQNDQHYQSGMPPPQQAGPPSGNQTGPPAHHHQAHHHSRLHASRPVENDHVNEMEGDHVARGGSHRLDQDQDQDQDEDEDPEYEPERVPRQGQQMRKLGGILGEDPRMFSGQGGTQDWNQPVQSQKPLGGFYYPPPPKAGQGYSGVEAYKEPKARRRWTFSTGRKRDW